MVPDHKQPAWNPLGFLHAAPPAFPDESANSWIQRVCGAHQYSVSRLKFILDIGGALLDFDVGATQEEWERILYLTHAPDDTCALGRTELAKMNEVRTSAVLMRSKAKAPKYRWCTRCFETDQTPYLRWRWRIEEVVTCEIHSEPLSELCGCCGGEVSLSFALLVYGAARNAVSMLSECQHYGMFLIGPPVDQVEHFSVANHPGRIWGINRFLMDEPIEWILGKVRGHSPTPLLIAGSTFRGGTLPSEAAIRKRTSFSKFIPRNRIFDRKKLAYALALIRREWRNVKLSKIEAEGP